MNFNLDPRMFLEDTLSQLDIMENILLDINDGKNDEEMLHQFFRSIHSIKGNAAIYNFEKVTEASHRLEDIIDFYRQNDILLQKKAANQLLKVKDILEHLSKLYSHNMSIDTKTELKLTQTMQILDNVLLMGNYELKKKDHINI